MNCLQQIDGHYAKAQEKKERKLGSNLEYIYFMETRMSSVMRNTFHDKMMIPSTRVSGGIPSTKV